MIRTMMLSGVCILAASTWRPAQAQTVRWNDRSTVSFDDESPSVRVAIEGDRAVGYGNPVRVRFQVSDNAFVTVVRVDGDGRMTILFPQSRNQRAAVRANTVYYARNNKAGGDFSFIANDMIGGYVFAIASYAPLDFASFENRDFDRVGGWSAFTVTNRNIARRPDVFIDRFAARVLWSVDTPYDYDVDYYSQFGHPSAATAYALCSPSAFRHYYGTRYSSRTILAQLTSFERLSYPYFSLCSGLYDRYQCISWLTFSVFSNCLTNNYPLIVRTPTDVNGGGGIPGGAPVDPNAPNEGVIRGGFFGPSPVPIPVDNPDGTLARETGAARFDQIGGNSDLEAITSIPARATKRMKDDDVRRDRGAADATGTARTGFDRGVAEKPEKITADATSAAPPSREPTKAKGAADPVRETTRSRTGFGTTGRTTGTDASTRDRDMGTRPVKASGSGGGAAPPPASLGGTSTTDKKKPPQD
jgi:hypothetical protein